MIIGISNDDDGRGDASLFRHVIDDCCVNCVFVHNELYDEVWLVWLIYLFELILNYIYKHNTCSLIKCKSL